MAEFGIVASALSVAALFNTCVADFEYIQLGKTFGRDFQTCQLRLGLARARLDIWGKGVDIDNHPDFDIPIRDIPEDSVVALAAHTFGQVKILLDAARQSARFYAHSAEDKREDPTGLSVRDLDPTAYQLYIRVTSLARQRQTRSSAIQKTFWAIYDHKRFAKLMTDIVGLIDDLERVFPVATARHELAVSVNAGQDEHSLCMIREASAGIDSTMSEESNNKIAGVKSRRKHDDIEVDQDASFVGNTQFGPDFFEFYKQVPGFKHDSEMVTGKITVKGRGQVITGDRYGVPETGNPQSSSRNADMRAGEAEKPSPSTEAGNKFETSETEEAKPSPDVANAMSLKPKSNRSAKRSEESRSEKKR